MLKEKNIKIILIVLTVLGCIIATDTFLLFTLLFDINGKEYDLESNLVEKEILNTKDEYATPTAVQVYPTPEPMQRN